MQPFGINTDIRDYTANLEDVIEHSQNKSLLVLLSKETVKWAKD